MGCGRLSATDRKNDRIIATTTLQDLLKGSQRSGASKRTIECHQQFE
jgi:hypothetical protein